MGCGDYSLAFDPSGLRIQYKQSINVDDLPKYSGKL